MYAIAPLRVTGALLLVEVRATARKAHLRSKTCTVLQVYGSTPCNGQPPATQTVGVGSRRPSARRLAAAGGAFAASTPQPRVCAGQVVHVVLDSKKAARGPGCAGELDLGSSFLVLPYTVQGAAFTALADLSRVFTGAPRSVFGCRSTFSRWRRRATPTSHKPHATRGLLAL